jgi:hypothetical protein
MNLTFDKKAVIYWVPNCTGGVLNNLKPSVPPIALRPITVQKAGGKPAGSAPPAYRPGVPPAAAQPKFRPGSAPPVYRPGVPPAAAQLKFRPGSAPPVYRPVINAAAAQPQIRPRGPILQLKATGPNIQPQLLPSSVIQAYRYTNTAHNRTTVQNRILAYYNNARNATLIGDAYWEDSADGTYRLYNCGSVAGGGGGYGIDYVTGPLKDAIENWWTTQQGGTVEAGRTRTFGTAGVGGHRRRAQDYVNLTKVAKDAHNFGGVIGTRRIILNFHLYTASYANPHYVALPPPAPAVAAAAGPLAPGAAGYAAAFPALR